MEDYYVYAIKPIGVTKGFGRVYNKQLYVGQYIRKSDIDIELIKVTDFNGKEIKKHSFPKECRFGTFFGIKTEDVGDARIHTGMPSTRAVTLFSTFIEAKLQKLIDIKHIKIYFEEEMRKLQERAEKNLPNNIEEIFEEYSGKYPEYMI